MVPIRRDAPDPQYLDAFLQGASFALFALEGRLSEDEATMDPEVAELIGEVHEMLAATRDGLEAREPSEASIRRYIGKN